MDISIVKPATFTFENYKKEKDTFKKFEMCFDYISEKLSNNAISVLVGAGFSSNANIDKTEDETKYLNWLDLLVDAYAEMYSNNPECHKEFDKKTNTLKISESNIKKIKTNIQNIGESEIAQQYEHFKGYRESLDLYIEKKFAAINLNTNNYEMHNKLLQLNWNDIITTNWDDLLERSNKIIGNEYVSVKEAKELSQRPNKRIVHLHGKLRKSEPEPDNNEYNFDNTYNYLYLITTKDFDNYKYDHEDFSNFMKVKMLENPFCLMGFSGRDLNFRYWIKELKRTMQKGGNTKEPNPIFLFDVNPDETDKKDLDYEESLQLFYDNNYIIRLRILDFYNLVHRNTYKNVVKGEAAQTEGNKRKLDYRDLNEFIFEYLSNKQNQLLEKQDSGSIDFDSQRYDSIIKDSKEYATESEKKENKQYSDKTKNSNKTLQTISINQKENIIYKISASNFDCLTADDISQYNTTERFIFQNIHTTSSILFKIQMYVQKKEGWNKDFYIFLSKWCLGNFYSLANLFEDNIIEQLIGFYDKSNYVETDAFVFAELILKYYREQDEEDKFNIYCERLSKYPQCNNIVIYSKAWRFIDKLEYNALKALLNSWHPEEGEQPDSIFIIRKISLLHMFENIRFYDDMKEEISRLFKIALDNCKEDQLKLFILLFQRQYLNIFTFQSDDIYKEQIKSLQEQELSEPYKYLDEFETKKSSNNDIKSNESKRYTITWKLSGNDSNQGFLNSIRVLNFFEYTGLSMELFLATRKIKSLIPNMSSSDYYLSKMFVHCISYFGNDSDEDFVKFSVDKIVRYFNSETIINIYNAIYKILVYKVNHQRNARSYLFICNELSKYFNDNSSELSKFIYSEIKESKDSNYQISNLIRRGRFWGAKRVFEDYLLKIQDEEEYKFILEWIINEYIKDERELVKQQHYTSSEFFDYYFDLLVKNPKKDLIQEVINQSDIIKLLEEDFSYEKQLCLYGYEFLPKDLSHKTKEFFETNFTIYTDPYFITIFKSDTLKNKIISIIQDDNPLSFNSRKYQITKYIRFLHHEKMFDLNDKILISNIIKTRIEKIISNKDYFSHGFTSLKDTIADLFYCLENITSEQDRNNSLEIKNIYDLVKTEFQNQIQDFYNFEWLYTDDYQKFRLSFSNAVSYFSYLHQAKEYLYIFNIVLSKLIVQDDSNFEAVLELFVTIYSSNYEKNILVNNEIHTLLLQLMKKYKLEIPYCYDYLFIKKQMRLLAEALRKNAIKDDVIDFWMSA